MLHHRAITLSISGAAARLTAAACAALLLAGCGGADLGGMGRNNAFDTGLTGSYNGYGGSGSMNAGRNGAAPALAGKGTYAKLETSFELPDIKGNPFDYTENDVQVTFTKPDNQIVKVPAFFDGGKTWRVRFTPDQQGRYAVSKVQLNGQDVEPEKMEKREFDVNGKADPGFVRIDQRDRKRFAFDNGNSYYPLGNNVGWDDVPAYFDKMGKAGENWSRVWMDHWDGKNLDWVNDKKLEQGTLDLDVAKKWDAIVDAAEKDGIYFQMVLQHHGQYSSTTNPNWNENPWNKINGGFLTTPDEFFTSQRAIALTRAKYRYILARWGYSPHIMAWELFNEVQWTDAINHKHADEVAAWHAGMAAFLRQQDPYKHLVTTSSDLDIPGLFQAMDYYQPHTYPPDLLAAVGALDVRKADKPIFYGEIGPGTGLESDKGPALHTILWGSLMSETSGAAEYWAWDTLEKNDLWGHLRSAADFVRQSGVASKRGLLSLTPAVETKERGALSFGPGQGWGTAKQAEYTVLPSGAVAGINQMPGYLQGQAHKEMGSSATFHVNYPEAGSFAVAVGLVSKSGGHLILSVDGTKSAEKEFAAGDQDRSSSETLEVKVPAGEHTVKVENTGADWVVVKQFTLSPYAPAIAALGKGNKDYAVLWLSNRGSATAQGKVTLPGMANGSYRVTWWDTGAGKTLSEETVDASGSKLALSTPPISSDVAAWVEKTTGKAEAKPKAPRSKTAKK